MHSYADFELARRHYVYTFNTNSTVTVPNDTKGIRLKRLWGVSIKRKNYTDASIKRVYEQYRRQRCSIIVSNTIYILKELI
jgi:hypothetical protein